MQLQSIFIAMVAFAVTGTYAGTNACFNTCGEKPDCAGRVSSTIQLNLFFFFSIDANEVGRAGALPARQWLLVLLH